MAEPKKPTRIALAQRPTIYTSLVVDSGSAPQKVARLPKTPLFRSPSRQQWKPPGFTEGIPKHPKYPNPGREPSNTSTVAQRFSSAIPTPIKRFFPNNTASPAPVAMEKSPRQTPESISKAVLGAEWWGATDIPFHDIMRVMNSDVDRSTARADKRDGSKLIIVLLNAYGKKKEFIYPVPIDWSDSSRVDALNRWRATIFKRYLGDLPNTCQVRPHLSEYTFVKEEYEKLQKEPGESHAQRGAEPPSWANIARNFNSRFEGRELEGDPTPRPRVTRENLRARYLGPLNKSREKIKDESYDEESTIDSASAVHSRSLSNASSTATTWSGVVRSNRDSKISNSPSKISLPRFPKILSGPEPAQRESSSSVPKPKPRTSKIPRLSSLVTPGDSSATATEYLDRVLPHRELGLSCCTNCGVCSQLQQ